MSIENSFQLIIKFFQFNFKLLGLLPTYEKFRLFFYFYSMAILFVIIYLYQNVAFIKTSNLKHSLENASKFATLNGSVFRIATITMPIFIYLFQWIDLKKHLSYNHKITKYLCQIYAIIGNDKKKYCNKQLRNFILIALIIFIIITTGIIYKYNYVHPNENSIIIVAISHIPIIYVPILIADFYWGIMLLFTYFFKQVNGKIKIIIINAQTLVKRAEQRNGGKIHFMQEFCNLSDQLDEMKSIHCQLSVMLLEFNLLWSKQMLVFMIWRFSSFVSNIYVQFVVFLKSIDDINMYGFAITSCCVTIVQFWTIISIIQSCADVTNEVKLDFTIYLYRRRTD